MKNVFLNWQLGTNFGWGILGLNLFCHWANDPDLRPLMGRPITDDDIGQCDPLRVHRAFPAMDASNRFFSTIATAPDGRRTVDAILVDALGNGFPPTGCHGRFNIGRCIFENTALAQAKNALARYDALLVASNWSAELLAEATGRRPQVIFEGVDPSLFCPGPRSGLMEADRFYVFSGGKVEFRKGQDLVLDAFRKFSAGRRDCVLVTAWHSPWPQVSAGFRGRLPAALEIGANGMLDITGWAQRNGLDPRTVIDIGFVPNMLMPAVLREMDVCLQPSRAEACTNLPVKEAMACGLPVIAGVNTGMRDLLTDDNCIPLRAQGVVSAGNPGETSGWGESDVDEIVAALEFAYAEREKARAIGQRARHWLLEHERTWQAHARALKAWLLSLA